MVIVLSGKSARGSCPAHYTGNPARACKGNSARSSAGGEARRPGVARRRVYSCPRTHFQTTAAMMPPTTGASEEEPDLGQGVAADHQRGPEAPGRVDRRPGDGDADDVDQGQGEADGQAGEALGRVLARGAEDDEQEERRQDDSPRGRSRERIRPAGNGRRSRSGRARSSRASKPSRPLGDLEEDERAQIPPRNWATM